MLGESILQYRIIEKIGSGGMGVVYKAEDTKLRRFVALKFLSENLANDEAALERFRREARTIASLDHPNICTIHDIAEHDGQPFLVMQWLDGETLSSRIKSQAVPLEDVRNFGIQIADGLNSAHAAGIIHRDIKPGNIFVTKDGQVKILDFGLARTARLSAADSSALTILPASQASLTASGSTLGTVAYMSPEQTLGKELDGRTDLFSFGIVLYEIATGKTPFDGNTTGAIINQIIHEAPADPTAVNPKIPDALERIIIKAISKSPSDRHQTAAELRSELAAFNPQTVRTRRRFRIRGLRSSTVKRVLKRGLVIGALGTVGVVFWTSRDPVLSFSERDTLMIGAVANQTGDPGLDGTISDILRISIEQSRYVDVLSSNRVRQTLLRMRKSEDEPLTEEIAREVCQRENAKGLLAGATSKAGNQYLVSLRVVDCVTGDAVRTLSETAVSREEIFAAVDSLAKSLRSELGESLNSISESKQVLDHVTTSSLDALKLYADGNFQFARGKYDEARKLFHRALELDPEFARAHAALGNAYAAYNINIEKAEEYFQEALKRFDQLTERERNEIRGMYHRSRGHHQEAVTYWRLLVSAYPKVDWYQYNLARNLQDLHQYKDAIAIYEDAIRINPYNANAFINIATSHVLLNQPQEAVGFYQKAFTLNPDSEVDSILNHEYGWTLIRAGRVPEARTAFEKMLAKSGTQKARGHRSLGLLALFRGQFDAASRDLEEAGRIHELANAYDSAARDAFYLGEAFVLAGRTQKGMDYLSRATQLVRLAGSPAWLTLNISGAYSRAGRTAQAENLIQAVRPKVRLDNPSERAFLLLAEAELMLAQRPSEEALEKVRTARALGPGTMSDLALSRALIRTGHTAEAAELLQKTLTAATSAWDSHVFWVLAHRDLAKLHAAAGRKSEAQTQYSRLVHLWGEADANLSPIVEAREAIIRLGS